MSMVTSLNAFLTVKLTVEYSVDKRTEASQDYCSNYGRNFIFSATGCPLHRLEDVHHVILVRPVNHVVVVVVIVVVAVVVVAAKPAQGAIKLPGDGLYL